MKKELKFSELLSLIPKQAKSDSKYCGWKKLDPKDFESFELIGSLNNISSNVAIETKANYWSNDYPISFSHYPNANSDVHFDGSSYYLVYRDFGGHVPETRCRRIQRHLILDAAVIEESDGHQSLQSKSYDLTFTKRFDSSNSYIQEIETKLGIKIPLDYRDFLLRFGGGIPEKNNYFKKLGSGGTFDFEISAFYGNSPDETSFALDFYYIMTLGVIPRGLLPIADDGIGHHICIGHSGEYLNKIYVVWDTEEEQLTDVVLLNNSLNEFISFLR